MGRHLLLEVYNVKSSYLDEVEPLLDVMVSAINRARMSILNTFTYKFDPQGLTIVIALAESHVSCHSWPENGCIAIDVYTCGENNPKIIATELLKYFDSYDYSIREIFR